MKPAYPEPSNLAATDLFDERDPNAGGKRNDN